MATIKLEGFKELEAELAKISKAAGRGVLERAGRKAMAPMADIARTLAPDDPRTGPPDLRSSIAVSTAAKGAKSEVGKRAFAQAMKSGASTSAAVAAKRTALREFNAANDVPFAELFMGPAEPEFRKKRAAIKAIVMEFGSFKDTPQPYMRPAWDKDSRPMLERLKKLLWDEVSKAVARAARKAAKG
jgi:hypothetical protein